MYKCDGPEKEIREGFNRVAEEPGKVFDNFIDTVTGNTPSQESEEEDDD